MSIPADLVIVCALPDPELKAVLRTNDGHWQPLPAVVGDPQTYDETTYQTELDGNVSVVAAAPNHMGMSAAAILATKMILRFNPRAVAIVGIAAGTAVKNQGYGDILVADHTFDYGSGKISREGTKVVWKPDPKPLSVEPVALSLVKAWQSKRTQLDDIYNAWSSDHPATVLKIHVGPIASGAAVVDDDGTVDRVKAHWRKLVGLEMEAHGVHQACEVVTPKPLFLCIKSICDFGRGKTDRWQHYAAYTAAAFCQRFFVTEWPRLQLQRRRVDVSLPVGTSGAAPQWPANAPRASGVPAATPAIVDDLARHASSVELVQTVVGDWATLNLDGIKRLAADRHTDEIDILAVYRVGEIRRALDDFRRRKGSQLRACFANMWDDTLIGAYQRKYTDREKSKIRDSLIESITFLLGPCKIAAKSATEIVITNVRNPPAAAYHIRLTSQRITFAYWRVNDVALMVPLDMKKAQNPTPPAWILARETMPRVFDAYRSEFDSVFNEASRVYGAE